MKYNNQLYPMVVILATLMLLISCIETNTISAQANETSSIRDSRDGRIYRIVKIGEQWIMAENLAYKPERGTYWAYDNDTANLLKYGYLYDWETAKNVALTGWHLPTQNELKILRKSLGGGRDIYKYLGGNMERVYVQMIAGGSSGFNALLAGIRTNDGSFKGLGTRTDFWSSSASKEGQWFYTLDAKTDGNARGFFDSKEGTAGLASQQNDAKGGKSIRLFKD